MEKERRIKGLSLVALVVAVLGLTVAFAALSQQLTIEGTATVSRASWDVHFDNLSLLAKTGGASAGEITDGLGIQGGTTIKLPAITLTKPGDTVSYNVDVVNGGSIDAKVTAIPACTRTITATSVDSAKNEADKQMVESNFVCKLTYYDSETRTETEVSSNDPLLVGNTKKMKITVGYSEDATEVPSDDVNVSDIRITMSYGQN